MLKQFKAGFEEQIRMEIDWAKLEATKASVSLTICSPQQLQIILPWHRKSGLENNGDWLQLEEIPAAIPELHPATRSAVLEYASSLSKNPQGQLLNVPAWRLPGGRLLALDGCHRLSGMKISGCKGQVCLWILDAPFDPQLMPFLMRLGAKASSSFRLRRWIKKNISSRF